MTVLNMDCIEGMRLFPDAYFDSIVTDPPYELGFMGKGWDSTGIANSVEMWTEALRVLKPGGHLLAFSGSRTYHRMVCAIEDAGFEIRDQIMWIYGSGFPKSLDVSKAIDKAGGASPVEQARLLLGKREAAGLSREDVALHVGCTTSSVRDWEEGRARASGGAVEFIVPSDDYRAKLADLLGYSEDERRVVGIANDRRYDGTVYGVGHSGQLRAGGNTDAARQWQGWGTALKPAHEPIVVARKPLIGTVAANVLAHGTGAINVDGCRVPGEGQMRWESPRGGIWSTDPAASAKLVPTEQGRWPANFLHDGSLSEEWSRYFYSAKASKADRNEGLDDFTSATTSDGPAVAADNAYQRGKTERLNTHPTVKPTDLMRYLCRLVTPPGGIVMDPFTGSGSTGKAAALEGFGFIGFELSAEYTNIATARIAKARAS